MSKQEKILENKIAVVTGAGSGIAQAIAVGLAEAGASVVIVGRNMAKLEKTLKLIEDKGGVAYPVAADVSKIDDVESMAKTVLSDYGVPSVLINGAGVYGEITPISSSDSKRWMQTIMINTVGAYLVCRAFMNEMVKLGWGRIINISSAASLGEPNSINSAYATSKVALNHFTRQLASELDKTGVTANVFHPGEVKTDLWAAMKEEVLASGTNNMLRWIKWVEETGGDAPEKIVKLVFDIIDSKSDAVNGKFLWIENGLKGPMPSWK